jgi:hypothetical protein
VTVFAASASWGLQNRGLDLGGDVRLVGLGALGEPAGSFQRGRCEAVFRMESESDVALDDGLVVAVRLERPRRGLHRLLVSDEARRHSAPKSQPCVARFHGVETLSVTVCCPGDRLKAAIPVPRVAGSSCARTVLKKPATLS